MEAVIWDRLLVDLIGPYQIRREGYDDPRIIKYITLVDTENGWSEIVLYDDNQEATTANRVEKMWLCRYPLPMILMYNCGNKFLGRAFKNYAIKNEYENQSKCATTSNPQEIKS